MSRAAALLTAAFLALVPALSGCTGGGDAPAAPPGAAAPVPTTQARDAVASAASGLAAAGSARVDATLDAPAGQVRATGPVRFTPFAADLDARLGPTDAGVRAVGNQAWFRMGDAGWQPLAPGMVPVGALTTAPDMGSGLRDVVQHPGTETVAGVPSVRYTGTIDLPAARAAAHDPSAATRLDELSGLVSASPRFTAWIGGPDAATDRGRLVRLRLEPSGDAASPSPLGGPVTIAFAEPGVPVRVAPPA